MTPVPPVPVVQPGRQRPSSAPQSPERIRHYTSDRPAEHAEYDYGRPHGGSGQSQGFGGRPHGEAGQYGQPQDFGGRPHGEPGQYGQPQDFGRRPHGEPGQYGQRQGGPAQYFGRPPGEPDFAGRPQGEPDLGRRPHGAPGQDFGQRPHGGPSREAGQQHGEPGGDFGRRPPGEQGPRIPQQRGGPAQWDVQTPRAAPQSPMVHPWDTRQQPERDDTRGWGPQSPQPVHPQSPPRHPGQDHPGQRPPGHGHPPQGRPQQDRPRQGLPQQGPPQGRTQQGHPHQGRPQQSHPQQQGHPTQGHPQQGHPRPPQQRPAAQLPYPGYEQPRHPNSNLVRTPEIPPQQEEADRAPRPDETFIIEPITMPPTRQAARMALRHSSWKPGILSGLIPFLVVLVFSWWLAQPGHGPLGWALTVLWSWPIISSLVGIYGALNTRVNLKKRRKHLDEAEAFRCNDLLVVVVPTIGRHDTYPALERSVLSYVHHLPSCFPQLRIDVITEEGCEAHDRIKLLGARSPLIRVVTVPKAYTTKNGTRFKARANHYSHELRISEGEARDDVWVLHMDDDTGVAMDTAIAMAHFIERQRWAGEDARHLAQGILTYPRENAVNMLTWLADAVRPADDIARFAAFTGAGTPLSGLHGELLLVRASIEATIGWDFGPKAIVEDAQLALTFCKRYPGRSSWFQGRCYGASPATVRDFIKQRERWAWGLVGLATNRTIPLRHRIFLAYSVVSWVAGPLQHVAFVLLVGAALGDMNTTPVSLAVLPLWAVNMGYTVWMYMEGLKINARVSENGRRKWWEPIAVICLIPVFSLMEGIGGFLGFVKFIRRAENKFVVIAKPA